MIKLYNVKLYGAKIKKSIDFNLKSKDLYFGFN